MDTSTGRGRGGGGGRGRGRGPNSGGRDGAAGRGRGTQPPQPQPNYRPQQQQPANYRPQQAPQPQQPVNYRPQQAPQPQQQANYRPQQAPQQANYRPQQQQPANYRPSQQQQPPVQFGQVNYRPQPQPPQQQAPQPNVWKTGPGLRLSVPASGTGPDPGSGVGGGNVASKLQRPSEGPTESGAIVPKMQALKIGEGTSASSSIVPIRRPDRGGVQKIRTVNILVNHFPVRFNPEAIIRHYDIDVKPEGGFAKGRPAKLSKATLSLLKDKLFADNSEFPLEMTGYDGEKNLFSAVRLPTGQFTVKLSDEGDTRQRSFIFSVNLVNEVKLHKLKDYLRGDVLQLPREVLQAMDVVMKENPRRHMVSIGKTFHPVGFNPNNDLGGGLVASYGFQHTLKPTSQGLALCLDYSVLAVRKRVSVLEFLQEHLRGFDLGNFQRLRRDILSALKGLKVTVTHRRTKQKYTVSGLTDRASDITFPVEDPNGQNPPHSMHLLDYFREKYPDINIKHPNLPCLDVGKGGRANYVPIEFCVLVEGQRFPKEELDFNAAAFLKEMSLAQPNDRKNTICGMVRDRHGPCGGDISKNFEIDVLMNMTRVQGRVIKPPQLMLKAPDNVKLISVPVDNDSCQWNLMRSSVVDGKSLLRWAVLDFSCKERDRLNDAFIPKLVARCNKLGLHMEPPLFIEGADMRQLSRAESLIPLMEKVNTRARQVGKGSLQLLLCVMSRKDHGYKHIKWVSETKIGVVTQCCLSKMANKGQDQYMANLGMKINAKIGGANVDLSKPLPIFDESSHVMLIGADVNHPSPMDKSSPSIAAIVGSTNKRVATKYIPRLSYQEHRCEKIKGFGRLCVELIESYEKINGVKPQKLLIFRDGVSEGQFDMVLREELLDLKKEMKANGFSCTVTLIVAQKRHQTRLFPEPQNNAGRSRNVPPGTVVDTTIVHPFEFDFYLCSHYGSIGTSKPTHYHILWDEHHFSSDFMQQIIYDLCFTFARCCKPVSLVPPVYYADVLAYRGRQYYEAKTEAQYSSGSSSSSSAASGASFDDSFYKLHANIENGMFFI